MLLINPLTHVCSTVKLLIMPYPRQFYCQLHKMDVLADRLSFLYVNNENNVQLWYMVFGIYGTFCLPSVFMEPVYEPTQG